MVNCSVLNCKSNNDKRLKRNKDESVRKELKYFRFPRDEKYANIWIEKCGRVGKLNTRTSYVCSKHFTKEHYARNLQHELLNYFPKNSRKLNWDAVPTEHLPFPSAETCKQLAESQPKKKLNSKKFVLEIMNSTAKIEFVVESEATSGFVEPDSIPPTDAEFCPASVETIPCLGPSESNSRIISIDSEPISNSVQLAPNSCSVENFVDAEPISNYLQSNIEPAPHSNSLETTTILNCVEIAPCTNFTEISSYENSYTDVAMLKYADKTTNTESIDSFNTESETVMLKKTIEALRKEIKDLNEECHSLRQKNDCINNIFTPGQQNKMLKPGKRIKWDADDISQAIELYTSGPKAYRILLEKNYPLPSVSTLKSWTSKKATKTFDKEDLLVDEMFDVDEFFEESGPEALSTDTMTFSLLETLTEETTENN